ncbi:MAG: hypothetical protein M8353_10345, partial [ANME-2 cluster archaeon]|nr:hypothetical protein [ANME-2 cluster archaeon]
AEREEADRQEAIEKRKEELRKNMEESQKEMDRQNARIEFFGNLVSILSVVEKTADVSIDVLSTLTGPAGQAVKTAYTVTKDVTKNMSESYVKGESMVTGALKGAGEAAVDITLDKFGGALVDKFGGKIPGFGKFESTVDYGKVSVSAFTKLVKETAEEGTKNIARENFKEAGKNGLQGQFQGELWYPFKKFLGFS